MLKASPSLAHFLSFAGSPAKRTSWGLDTIGRGYGIKPSLRTGFSKVEAGGAEGLVGNYAGAEPDDVGLGRRGFSSVTPTW